MAYTFFPKTTKEIDEKLKNTHTPAQVSEISAVFNYLHKKFPRYETPINIDTTKSKINIIRSLQGDIEIPTIKRDLKLVKIGLKFGNGSMGGRGVNNKGNAFEGIFANRMREWLSSDPEQKDTYTNAIEHLNSIYDLSKYPDLYIDDTQGAANTKRPLVFQGNSILISPKPNNNIGSVVTDVTVYDSPKSKNVIAYLSMKDGTTTTFFNVGVRTILTPVEIKRGVITNKQGLQLLKLFNIDDHVFCEVFNKTLKRGYSVDVWSKMTQTQKNNLQKLIESGIGNGYHVIHKTKGKIHSYKVDSDYMKTASKPTSCKIYYGGLTGTGRRIDMVIDTPKYILKLNIRDTQGSDGYPTRMMCDFTLK